MIEIPDLTQVKKYGCFMLFKQLIVYLSESWLITFLPTKIRVSYKSFLVLKLCVGNVLLSYDAPKRL